jgi:FkbM family methyltransferase
VPIALSRVPAIVPFFETINDQGLISTSSSLEQGHAMQVGTYIRREITTETLDDWAEATLKEPVQLIKMDVEGHEHAVIEGGRRDDRPASADHHRGGAWLRGLQRAELLFGGG